MTQIATIQKSLPTLEIKRQMALEILPSAERKFIEAGLAPALKELPEQDVTAGISILIATAFTNAGQPLVEDQLNQICANVSRRVKEEFPSVTLEELRIAFDNGVFERYGPHYGLNAKSFVGFVRKYLNDPDRNLAKTNYKAALASRAHLDIEQYAPWESEYWNESKIEKWSAIAEEFYDIFLNNGIATSFVPQQIFFLLAGLQLIDVTPKRIEQWKARARAKMIDDYSNSKRKSLAKSLADLAAAIESGENQDINRDLGYEARRIAVLDYFTRLKESGYKTIFQR